MGRVVSFETRFWAHFWTVWPLLRDKLAPSSAPAAEAVTFGIEDPDLGRLALSGRLRVLPASRRLVALLHGLGGSAESRYLREAALVAERLGLSSLRLNQRGADGSGEDLYHAGLSSDLGQVLASPLLASFDEVYLLGFSLGGHLALKHATELADSRVRAVAAVCSPLDLDRSVAGFDRPSRKLYRTYVMRSLGRTYGQVAARRPLPVPAERVRRLTKLRDFDTCAVVPRFGFESVEDYYTRSSVGPRLGGLRVPTLLVASDDDPMVWAEAIRPCLQNAPPHLEVRWVRRGGHVGFSPRLDLGYGEVPGIAGQVLGWLLGAG